MKNLSTQLSRSSTTLITLNLRISEHSADQKAFEELSKSRNAELIEAKATFEQSAASLKEQFRQAQNVVRELKRMIDAVSPEVKDKLEKLRIRLTEQRDGWMGEGEGEEECLIKQKLELKDLLSKAQMDLKGIHPVDLSIMDRYKKNKPQALWRPRLDEMITSIDEKFDAAFKRKKIDQNMMFFFLSCEFSENGDHHSRLCLKQKQCFFF
ncbi:hypothetical protein MJO28_014573 [Puccinia striiformis f. sp. tritici]|uniref:Uncharacterized protein n=1 Tax=Puccinia striiformis f. sp. tritici TaxID=168172 RepID=A0ACC0DVY8_9BASI|nr:hypothetical protein MJO28_014573 [Puccinia striiformis f. sp. tritici]